MFLTPIFLLKICNNNAKIADFHFEFCFLFLPTVYFLLLLLMIYKSSNFINVKLQNDKKKNKWI